MPIRASTTDANMLRERIYHFVWKTKRFLSVSSIGLVVLDADTQSLASVLSAAYALCRKTKGGIACIYQLDDSELVQQRGEMQWVSRITKALEESLPPVFPAIVPIAQTETKSDCEDPSALGG